MRMERNDVKITVLGTTENPEIFGEYAAEGVKPRCPLMEEGREFISEAMRMPEGFCSWAWADIQRDVAHLTMGGSFPWMKEPGTMISCCTDGLRPVVFRLEARPAGD